MSYIDPGAVPPRHKANLVGVMRAFRDGNVCLAQCQSVSDPSEFVTLLCGVYDDGEGSDSRHVVPFARMLEGNPCEQYVPVQTDRLE